MEVCRFLRGDNGVFQAMSKPQQVEAARFNQTQVSPNSGDICKIAKSIEITKVYFEANSEFRNMEKVWLTMEEKLIMWVDKENDIYDKMEVVKEKIGFPQVNDYVLEEWAKILVSCVMANSDISENAEDLVESILRIESDVYFRLKGGYDEEENSLLLSKWDNLLYSIIKGFPQFSYSMRTNKQVLQYCQERGFVGVEKTEAKEKDTPQVLQAKAEFKLTYGEYIENIDSFFETLKTIKARQLKKIYDTKIKGSGRKGKTFLKDCLEIVPERKEGENRITYDNFKTFHDDDK